MRDVDDFTPGCWICDPDAAFDGEEGCAACFADDWQKAARELEGLPVSTRKGVV
jgi:hypothetical protein